MSDFQELKLAILDLLHLSRDAIHLHLGLFVFIAVLLLLRGRGSPWLAWFAVVTAALVLELLDLRDDHRSLGVFRWAASFHDIVNTLIWPTVLTLLIHFGRLVPPTSASPRASRACQITVLDPDLPPGALTARRDGPATWRAPPA